jgi:hypothetical protein
MPDRLELDLASIPPTYRGDYLIHSLAVPAAEFDPLVEERAQTEHGRSLYELSPMQIEQVRQAIQIDTRAWALKRRYHIANCPGCIGRKQDAGHKKGVGRVPED